MSPTKYLLLDATELGTMAAETMQFGDRPRILAHFEALAEKHLEPGDIQALALRKNGDGSVTFLALTTPEE